MGYEGGCVGGGGEGVEGVVACGMVPSRMLGGGGLFRMCATNVFASVFGEMGNGHRWPKTCAGGRCMELPLTK